MTFSQTELMRHLKDLRHCAKRQEEFVLVFDLAGSTVPGGLVRKTWAEFRSRAFGPLDGNLLGEAFVVSSHAHCGLIRAINGLAPPEHLQRFFRSRSQALRWAHSILKRHGLQATPAVRKSSQIIVDDGEVQWRALTDLSKSAWLGRQR